MQSAAAKLPEDPIELHAEVLRLQDGLAASERRRAAHEPAIEARERHLQHLLDDLALLKRQRFAPPDRISPDPRKRCDAAALEALIAEREITVAPPATPRQADPEPPKDQPVRRP